MPTHIEGKPLIRKFAGKYICGIMVNDLNTKLPWLFGVGKTAEEAYANYVKKMSEAQLRRYANERAAKSEH